MKRLLSAFTLGLAACTPVAATGIGGEWHLVGQAGRPAAAPLSITFTSDARFTGQAPCNRYFGSFLGELPQVSLSSFASTRMACEAKDVEAAYFEAFAGLLRVELADDRLFLIGSGGRVMEFSRKADETLCLSCGDAP